MSLNLENLSGEQILKLVDITVAGLKRDPNPFDVLLEDINIARNEFMCKHRDRPTRVFLGHNQCRAFEHMPPWQIVKDPAYANRSEQVMGLEVIRVLKDSFLQVA
jgi:hypothetical protein